MREIVLDTETTGLDPTAGDRIIEIGCLELEEHIPTGKHYQSYLYPERTVSEKTVEITGLTDAILADKPRFAELVDDFLGFIGDDILVIHNAEFDLGFINAELARIGRPPLENKVVDTLAMARRKFPGAPASLDALCQRYKIDLSVRGKHGALLDSNLLAQVYLELRGGSQPGLLGAEKPSGGAPAPAPLPAKEGAQELQNPAQMRPTELPTRLTEAEKSAHNAFLDALNGDSFWPRQ